MKKQPKYMEALDTDEARQPGFRYPNMTLNEHHYVPGRPHYPHPEWALEIGIPEHCNVGEFDAVIQPSTLRKIMLVSNHNNRPMTESRIRPLMISMDVDAFREDHVDPAVVDWLWELRNSQKRMAAAIEANKPLRIRFRYGCDPALIPYLDSIEWRKYHHRWVWTKNEADNEIICKLIGLYFKIYSGLGTGSMAHSDAVRIWELRGRSFQWVAELVRRNPLGVKQASKQLKSPRTVSSYLALAEFHYRDKARAACFANEVYMLEPDSKANQQGRAYMAWINREKGSIVVDQRKLYSFAVYFMRYALRDEPVPYGVDKRITKVRARGLVEPGVRVPEPKVTMWDDEQEEHRTVLQLEGKEKMTKELTKKYGVTCISSVMAAMALLHREGMAAPQIKELVMTEIPRWNASTYFGRKFYRALRGESPTKPFCAASCVAFFYNHIQDNATGEAFLEEVGKREFLRHVLKVNESVRNLLGFNSRLGRKMSLEKMEEALVAQREARLVTD